MDEAKNSLKRPIHTLNCRGRMFTVDKPVVMGIVNVTPDSFFQPGQGHYDPVELAMQMIAQGASIIDVGGQSTRPGSERIGAEVETERVVPVIREILRRHPEALISIDTYHHRVAAAAVEAGARIVNDISAGDLDPLMIPTVASLGVPYVMMHMKGEPSTMQDLAVYDDIVREVMDHFITRIDLCRKAGIRDIILDPGFGFAKTAVQNLHLLGQLKHFRMFGLPILAGLSRKSTIYRTLGTGPEGALNGTTVLNTIALLQTAQVLRVHDVREAMEAITLVEAYSLAQ